MDPCRLAELIGILLGDGCIGVYPTKAGDKIKIQHRVKITLDSEADKEYSFYVANLLSEVLGVTPLLRKRKGENTLDILTFRKAAVEALQQEGMEMSPKWGRARIPQQFTVHALCTHVLRGYFDTDGAVVPTMNNGTLYIRLEMKVSPGPFQQQFQDILSQQGFKAKAYDIGKGKVRIQLNGRAQALLWRDSIGFSNPKHSRKLEEYERATASAVAPQ